MNSCDNSAVRSEVQFGRGAKWRFLKSKRVELVVANHSRVVRVAASLLIAGTLLCLTFGLVVSPANASDINITKTASAGVVKAGDPFTYTLTVFNATGYEINAIISDTIPAGVTIVNPGNGNVTNGVIKWSSVTIPNGTSVQKSFIVSVNHVGEVVNSTYGAASGSIFDDGPPVSVTIIPNDPANITLTANPTSVEVGGSSVLTVRITDAYSNSVVDGTTATLRFDKGTIDGQTAGTPINATTSGGQIVKTLLGGTVAGTAHVTATVGSLQSTTSVDLKPGPPSSLVVTVSPSSILANGSTTAAITATIRDSYGNPVAETPVIITTSIGRLNGNSATAVMNTSNGQVTATLDSTVAGTARLTVTTGSLLDTSQSINIMPGPPTHLSLQAVPSAITADGSSTAAVTLLVLDEHNNQVNTSVPVTITASSGTLNGGGTTYTETTNDGRVQVLLTSSLQAGTANISATALGLNTATSVNYVPGPPTFVTLNASSIAISADGVSTAVLTATVRDINGNPIDTPVGVTFTAGSGTFLPNNQGTTLNGVITRTLRSSTTLGVVSVTATAAGIGNPATGNIEFVVGPPSLVVVSSTPASPVTAGVPISLTLTVYDSVGHVVPSANITITSGLGSFNPSASGVTDGNGQLQRTLISTRIGTDILGVFGNQGVLNVNNGSIVFISDAPVQATLTASPNQLFANGSTTAVVTATLKDQYGNPVSNVVPNFTTSLGTLAGSGSTNASGIAMRTLQSTTDLGIATISASGLLTVTNATVNFVTGPAAIANLGAQPTTATANGTDIVTLVITVTDSVGHPIIGQTLAVTSSIGTISGSGATTNQGVLTRTLFSTKIGQPQIYVAGIATIGSVVTFVPGPLYQINVTPYGSSSIPTSASAGVSLPFSAVGYDRYNNVVDGLSFVWTKATQGGDGIISGNGIFTGTLAGLVQVKASAGGKNGVSFVKVGPGAAAKASIDANPQTLPADGVSASSLTFYITDVYGNPVGAGIPLAATSSIGVIEGVSLTDASGAALRTIRSTQAGQAIIGATNLITITGENVITFTPGSPKQAVISASPDSLPANGVATSTIRVTLRDNLGNPVGAGYTPIIQVSSGTVSGGGSTDTNGVVTRTLTSPLVEGTASFTVKYSSTPLSVSGDIVSYVIGPLDHVVVTPDGFLDLAAGQPVTFTAQAYDEFNAPIQDDVAYGWNLEFNGPGQGEQDNFFGPQVTFIGTTAGTGVRLISWAEKDSPYSESDVDITVLPGPPTEGTLNFGPTVITADGISPVTITLTNLVDDYGNLVADNSLITATIQTIPIARTNMGMTFNGEANIILAAPTQAGTYPISVTSSVGPLQLSGPTEITFEPGPPAQAQVLSVTPPVIIANGTSTSVVTLQLSDAFGNKVSSGLTPVVSATLGTVLPGGGPTDSNGILTRTLQAGLVVGETLLSVDSFASTGPQLDLIPGPPVSATVTVVSPTLATGGNSTLVTFNISDAWNHPVADGTLITPTLAPSYGTFSGVRQTNNGLINQTLTSGGFVGTATIGSTGLSVTGDKLVTFVPGPAAIARVNAVPSTLTVGETTFVTITVTDAYSNIVPPTFITTSAIFGSFDGNGSSITKMTANGSGVITANLSSTVAGTETFTLAGPDGPLAVHAASNTILFLPKEPLTVTLDPPGPITATAGVTLTVVASSRDQYINAVDPWTPVGYTWWQSATIGSPGYGILLGADLHARSVYFKPTKVGSNRIWATGGVTTSNTLLVNVIAGAPAVAVASIAPTSVPADGHGTYTVTLTGITDAFGNIIPDGIPITVTVASDPPIISNGTVQGGVFIKTLSSSTNAGIHSVVVTGPGGALVLSGNTTVTFTPGPPVRAFVSATPDTLPADGVSTSELDITIYDSHSNPVSSNIPITVTSSSGTIIVGSGATVNGHVTRTLQSPVALGTAIFTVEDPSGQLFVSGDTVEFVPGIPAQALVTAAPPKVLADGISSSQISVTIKDGYGFTVPTNGVALLSIVYGQIVPTSTVAAAGSFTATFIADTSVGSAGFGVTYDGTHLPIVGDNLQLIPGPAVSATVLANPTSLAVGTNQQSNLTITLADAWGRPIANNTAVTVTTSLGNILSNTTTTVAGRVTRVLTPGLTMGPVALTVTTEAGSLTPAGDQVTIIPGNLHHITIVPTATVQVNAGNKVSFSAVGYDVYGNETGTGLFSWHLWPSTGNGTLASNGAFTGTIAGTVGIQASQGTFYSSIKDVNVLPGIPITAVVSASPITIPIGGMTSNLTITTRDGFGNLVANDTTLNVTTNLGTISGATTTRNGILTRTLTSGIYHGQATIFVNGFAANGDKVNFIPKSRVTAFPISLNADGISETTLTIEIFDSTGAPLADGTMPVVTTSLGTLSGNSSIVGGKLTRTLRASLTPGIAEIFVNGLQAEGNVPFLIGPASIAQIQATPPWLMADGISQSALTIKVQDIYGHIITNTGPLTVTTSRGTITSFAPTVNGITTRILTSSLESGAAVISVDGLTTDGDAKIHFVGNSLQNSSFENEGLTDWSVGQVTTPTGSTPAYSASVLNSDSIGDISITSPSGSTMVRLGATSTDKNDHQLSEVWLSQPVYIATGGLTQLTFEYRILSYDVAVGSPNNGYKEWDPFEVYLNGREVMQDGVAWSQEWNNWYQSLPTSPKDLGWKQAVLDLSPYAGQVVNLEFRVPNRQAPRDNTWVYLDGFNLVHREIVLHQVYLPQVNR